MEEPKSLDSLFKEKVFRIPDYQRGYAWQREQLKDFWEDLVNLSENRSHYTGVLTLKLLPATDAAEDEKEYWLVEDHSYKVFHIMPAFTGNAGQFNLRESSKKAVTKRLYSSDPTELLTEETPNNDAGDKEEMGVCGLDRRHRRGHLRRYCPSAAP